MENGLRDGRLLRGEVLARWQEFVGTGELFRALEARMGRPARPDRRRGHRPPGTRHASCSTAIESQLVTLLRGVAADAAEAAYTGWQAHPAGAALLEPALEPVRAPTSPSAPTGWSATGSAGCSTWSGERAATSRFVARTAAYAVNATGLAVMIAVFASTAFIPTGLEIAAAAGTTVAAQKVLEAIFGDQAIRTLAAKARQDLLDRVDDLLDEEAARYFARIEAVGVDADPGGELRASAEAVSVARTQAQLTSGDRLALPDERPPVRAEGPLSLPAEGPRGIAGPASS